MSTTVHAAIPARHALPRRSLVQYLEFLPPRLRILAEPFELFLATAASLSGLLVVLGTTRPLALQAQVSPWMLRTWGAALLTGGTLTVVARWLMARAATEDQLETASHMEKLGMILFATTAAMYGAAVMSLGRAGLVVGPMILGWSAACATRALIINRQWRAHEAARDLRRNTE